jgi:hypothetical protein
MNLIRCAATLALMQFLINCSPALSHERLGFVLSPGQTRIYHACLKDAWIYEYCHANSWRWSRSFERTFPACVLANRGGRFPLESAGWYNADDYCWSLAKGSIR